MEKLYLIRVGPRETALVNIDCVINHELHHCRRCYKQHVCENSLQRLNHESQADPQDGRSTK